MISIKYSHCLQWKPCSGCLTQFESEVNFQLTLIPHCKLSQLGAEDPAAGGIFNIIVGYRGVLARPCRPLGEHLVTIFARLLLLLQPLIHASLMPLFFAEVVREYKKAVGLVACCSSKWQLNRVGFSSPIIFHL